MSLPTPTASPGPTALIAEDEPLLARALERLLREHWPELSVVARAADGPAAVAAALAQWPDILFLDVQMPGSTGLEVAAEVADEWPAEPESPPLPLLVFVTAFDQFALSAFEHAAVDYVLKPVTHERLALTVARLRQRLAERAQASTAAAPAPDAGAALVRRVQAVAQQAKGASHTGAADEEDAADHTPIRVIRAAHGPGGALVKMIPLAEVLCFEAADKYVQVITEAGEALVRMSLRELAARIEGVEFLQVHRSVLVNAARIEGAERDEAGHYWLTVRGLKRPLKVSRAFSHLFRPM